jgi:secreted trypsin-like serine protease
MVRLPNIILLVVFIFLDVYSVQALIFACNTTAPCGCSQNEVIINSRIVGGEPAASHSWGWAVSLRVRGSSHFCGGTILSPNYILTAAHCIDDPIMSRIDITAAVGTDNLYDSDGQRIIVSKLYKHPSYNSVTKENDIGILKLKKAISFKNKNIAKLCLPSTNGLPNTDFPSTNSQLVAIGWGTTSSGGTESSVLRQVTVQGVSNTATKCSNSIKNVRLQFCAAVNGGGKGKMIVAVN